MSQPTTFLPTLSPPDPTTSRGSQLKADGKKHKEKNPRNGKGEKDDVNKDGNCPVFLKSKFESKINLKNPFIKSQKCLGINQNCYEMITLISSFQSILID